MPAEILHFLQLPVAVSPEVFAMGHTRMAGGGQSAEHSGEKLKITTTARDGNEQLRLVLTPRMDAAQAEPLRRVLAEAVTFEKPVHVDTGAVEQISTPCLQLLVAAARASAETAQRLSLANPSYAFEQACMDLGLDAPLAEWTDKE